MRTPLEKDIQRVILDWLRAWKAFPIRVNSGAFTGEHKGKKRFVRFTDQPGCSDILCCLPDGRFAAIEVKRPGNEPSDEQRSFLQMVNKCGGLGIWVRSLDELIADLREAGYRA